MWESLVGLYDNLVKDGKPVCPIAHTYIAVHIAILLDQDGNFLCAMEPPVKGEMIPVPCTIESESRTSGVAPHLISDQLQYISEFPKFENKHKAYISQLKKYVNKNPRDLYAEAIFKYVSKGTVYADIKNVIPKSTTYPIEKLNALFAVYGIPYEGQDPLWTEYYLSTLKPNGICCVTGKQDFIPKTYPACILSPNGKERFFLTGSPVGYIAGQKIIHALQYLMYGKSNHDRVEAEYKIQGYLSGDISESELKEWVDQEYPSVWDGFIKSLNNGNKGENLWTTAK